MDADAQSDQAVADLVGQVESALAHADVRGGHGGSRVAPEHYRDDFAFTGTLKRVTIDLSGDLIVDSDTDMKVAMARQ